jgi:hypothetical protein
MIAYEQHLLALRNAKIGCSGGGRDVGPPADLADEESWKDARKRHDKDDEPEDWGRRKNLDEQMVDGLGQ